MSYLKKSNLFSRYLFRKVCMVKVKMKLPLGMLWYSSTHL